MINALNLLWIVALAAVFGLFVGALCNASKDKDEDE